ncbi:hypothetical protein EV363DRAFT_1366790 [Boletus edulis]|nr:hypothetical protein EV363DRAFT_1366790 [Boletus edulis]
MSVSYQALSISFGVIKCLAVFLTLFRLGFRLKIRRFWWEDVWATVALLCTVASIISVFVVNGTSHREAFLIASRINVHMLTCIVWSVRISVTFSIVRICPSPFLRRVVLGVAACFFLVWVTTLSLEVRWCGGIAQTPSGEANLLCVIPRSVIIFQMTTNCTADTIIAVFPIRLLFRAKLPRRQRRMFVSIFSASRFLCAASLARLVLQLVAPRSIQEVVANMQLAIFLICCNLLVVVTWIYRVLLTPRCPGKLAPSASPADDEANDDDFTVSPSDSKTLQVLTTVDMTTTYAASVGDITLKHKKYTSTLDPPSMSESV